MSKPQTPLITDVIAASAAVIKLPSGIEVELSGGRRVTVSRLSWLKFEAAWAELAGLLTALAGAGEDAGEDELLSSLGSAPAAVLRLVALCTGEGEAQLAEWAFDDVLAVAAAALQLNFIDSSGVRDFSVALGGLAKLGG
jgi:hypothetical protein